MYDVRTITMYGLSNHPDGVPIGVLQPVCQSHSAASNPPLPSSAARAPDTHRAGCCVVRPATCSIDNGAEHSFSCLYPACSFAESGEAMSSGPMTPRQQQTWHQAWIPWLMYLYLGAPCSSDDKSSLPDRRRCKAPHPPTRPSGLVHSSSSLHRCVTGMHLAMSSFILNVELIPGSLV